MLIPGRDIPHATLALHDRLSSIDTEFAAIESRPRTPACDRYSLLILFASRRLRGLGHQRKQEATTPNEGTTTPLVLVSLCVLRTSLMRKI